MLEYFRIASKIRDHQRWQPMLSRTKELTRPAQLKIGLSKFESVSRRGERLESLRRLFIAR